MAHIIPPALFNDAYNARNTTGRDATFEFFSRLPPELRGMIWSNHLRQMRFITVEVSRPSKGATSSRSYALNTQRRYRHSKLLRVNREARLAALAFYRVRIVCDDLGPTPLYFNPEFDFLNIRQNSDVLERVADFLHDVTQSGSHNNSIQNLALDRGVFRAFKNYETLDKRQTDAIVFTMSNVRRLWSVHLEVSEARTMAGGLSWLYAKVHHNRSLPVFSNSAAFEVLDHDPRPIDLDLEYIATFQNPQDPKVRWEQLAKNLNIQRKEPLDYRVLIASMPGNDDGNVVDRSTAHAYLETEEKAFNGHVLKLFRPNAPASGQYLTPEVWEKLKSSLPDAVGFWLFTGEAFDHFPDDGKTQLKRVRDLRKYRPQLGVFDLL